MPWRARDAKRHINGLTADQAHAWSVIANAALKEYGDEGRAIRTANAKAPRTHRENGYASEQRKAAANAARAKGKR
jgi:uncharacterized protein YdaT